MRKSSLSFVFSLVFLFVACQMNNELQHANDVNSQDVIAEHVTSDVVDEVVPEVGEPDVVSYDISKNDFTEAVETSPETDEDTTPPVGCSADADCDSPLTCWCGGDEAVCQLGRCLNSECVEYVEVAMCQFGCENGGCVMADCYDDVNCEDSNPCTFDFCNFHGYCEHFNIADCQSCIDDFQCNDENACTVDFCSGGQCVNVSTCDDGDSCTADWCSVNGCEHTNICAPEVIETTEVEEVTEPEVEDDTDEPVDCISNSDCGSPVECWCSGNQANCQSASCVNSHCVFVVTIDSCHSGCNDGHCEFYGCESDEYCGDADVCTIDYCNFNGNCEYVNVPDCRPCSNDEGCDDAKPCTRDFCSDGQCRTLETECNDYNMCTVDICYDTGCQFFPLCENQLLCVIENGGAHCVEDCNDNDACTIDVYDPFVHSCIHGLDNSKCMANANCIPENSLHGYHCETPCQTDDDCAQHVFCGNEVELINAQCVKGICQEVFEVCEFGCFKNKCLPPECVYPGDCQPDGYAGCSTYYCDAGHCREETMPDCQECVNDEQCPPDGWTECGTDLMVTVTTYTGQCLDGRCQVKHESCHPGFCSLGTCFFYDSCDAQNSCDDKDVNTNDSCLCHDGLGAIICMCLHDPKVDPLACNYDYECENSPRGPYCSYDGEFTAKFCQPCDSFAVDPLTDIHRGCDDVNPFCAVGVVASDDPGYNLNECQPKSLEPFCNYDYDCHDSIWGQYCVPDPFFSSIKLCQTCDPYVNVFETNINRGCFDSAPVCVPGSKDGHDGYASYGCEPDYCATANCDDGNNCTFDFCPSWANNCVHEDLDLCREGWQCEPRNPLDDQFGDDGVACVPQAGTVIPCETKEDCGEAWCVDVKTYGKLCLPCAPDTRFDFPYISPDKGHDDGCYGDDKICRVEMQEFFNYFAPVASCGGCESAKDCSPLLNDCSCSTYDNMWRCQGESCINGQCVLLPTQDLCDNGCNPNGLGCAECISDGDCVNDEDLCTSHRCNAGVCEVFPTCTGEWETCHQLDMYNAECVVPCVNNYKCRNILGGNPCTEQYCDFEGFCRYGYLNGITCDKGDDCSMNDYCNWGICETGDLAPTCGWYNGGCMLNGVEFCDDGDPCTFDICEERSSSCVHETVPNCHSCEKKEDCGSDQYCILGYCEVSNHGCTPHKNCGPHQYCYNRNCYNLDVSCDSDMECDDLNLCTIDSCVNNTCNNIPDLVNNQESCLGYCFDDTDCAEPENCCCDSLGNQYCVYNRCLYHQCIHEVETQSCEFGCYDKACMPGYGVLDVSGSTIESNSNRDLYVVGGQVSRLLGSVKFYSRHEDINVSQLVLYVKDNSEAYLDISQVLLFDTDGTNLLAITSNFFLGDFNVNDTPVVFSNLNFAVPADQTKKVYVAVRTNEIGLGANQIGSSGVDLAFRIASVTAEGNSSGVSLDVSGSSSLDINDEISNFNRDFVTNTATNVGVNVEAVTSSLPNGVLVDGSNVIGRFMFSVQYGINTDFDGADSMFYLKDIVLNFAFSGLSMTDGGTGDDIHVYWASAPFNRVIISDYDGSSFYNADLTALHGIRDNDTLVVEAINVNGSGYPGDYIQTKLDWSVGTNFIWSDGLSDVLYGLRLPYSSVTSGILYN